MRNERPPPKIARLRAFDAVGATGSVTRGAAQLRLTQPALTHAIRELERELGATLLNRGRTGSYLTPEGEILYRRTQRFFRQAAEAVAAITGRPAGESEPVGVARKIGDVHMRTLLAIWRAGSFKKAAAQLKVEEPTIYRPARDLEGWTGEELYAHTADGLGLSRRGKEFARLFAVAHTEIITAIEELAAHLYEESITVRVGVVPLAPKRRLAAAANRLTARNSRARVMIEEGLYPELVEMLRSGALDFIFGSLHMPAPFPDLEEEDLFQDRFAVACRVGHPLLANPSRSIADFLWIFPRQGTRRRTTLDEVIAAHGLNPRVQLESNSITATVAAMVTSDCLSLLPRVCIDEFVETIAAVHFDVPQPHRSVGITRRVDWLPNSAQIGLIELLKIS